MLRFQTRGFGRPAQFERLPTKDFTGFVPWCCLRHMAAGPLLFGLPVLRTGM